jgi:hypothetical protein
MQMDWFFGGVAVTVPTNIYFSLHTADPLDDGSASNEVTVTTSGYARQLLANGIAGWNAGTTPANDSPTIVTNKLAIPTFGPSAGANAAWGTITFFGMWSTVTGTTLFYGRGPVTPSQGVTAAGQSVTIPIGNASFTNNSS